MLNLLIGAAGVVVALSAIAILSGIPMIVALMIMDRNTEGEIGGAKWDS